MRKDMKTKVVECISKIAKIVKKDELGKHLDLAINEHDLSWLSDKELFEILNDYLIELEIDGRHDEKELNRIISEGMNLNNILEED